MSDSGHHPPTWGSTVTSTVSQNPALSATRFNAQADPFVQPARHAPRDLPYSSYLEYPANTLPDLFPPPIGYQAPTVFPNPYDAGPYRPPRHYPPFPSAYQYLHTQPPVPRPPVFSPDRPTGGPADMTGFVGSGNLPPLPNYPVMRSGPMSPMPYPQTYGGNYAPTNPAPSPMRPHQYRAIDSQPPVRYSGGQDFEATLRQNQERSRQYLPVTRRPSQQGPRSHNSGSSSHTSNRSYDLAERRAARLNAQGRFPEGNVSPPTSGRRNYDSFIHDVSRATTSSDAEEAAARIPPQFRGRRWPPREPRLRFGHAQLQDPNVATDEQIKDLKHNLPRRLPSELVNGTSSMCDICAKDYSSAHVKASEEQEIAIELPCGHCFGEFCIFEWFDTCKKHKNKITCPMCRKQLIEPSASPSRYHHALLMSSMARGEAAFQEMLASELRGDFAHM
ncbi:hypothetical protein DE146DRAFT_512056 [Phaeosphaeria sp. MPI-PUGE-AT-0046c]|nr:hypothetical protein DE146DRAFT_512056 [Phaeosphaeria sp. MPI-PUGE-AT-0046c]